MTGVGVHVKDSLELVVDEDDLDVVTGTSVVEGGVDEVEGLTVETTVVA